MDSKSSNKIKLTAGSVNRLPFTTSGQKIYLDTEIPGFGVLVGKKTKSYFIERRVNGGTVRHKLGRHGEMTADQARDQANTNRIAMSKGVNPVAEKEAEQKAREEKRLEALAVQKHTLGKLCDWYVTHLKKAGKVSARDANHLFTRHVTGSEFEHVPARDFTAKQATAMVRKLVEAGKGRTAGQLRSYLRAAYALALGAETNPTAPAELVLFGVESNPIAATAALSQFNQTRRVVVHPAEVGEILRLLESSVSEQYDDALAAFYLSILLGGQRLAQIVRPRATDVNLQERTLLLYDPKGRRKTPRPHLLPLTEPAFTLMEKILQHRRGEWLFGGGKVHTSAQTVTHKASELMAKARQNLKDSGVFDEKTVLSAVQPRDLRRTAETMMAAMGISKDVRAQVQSHGLGGVQDRHYDMHEYMTEKSKALKAWNRKLQALMSGDAQTSNVRELNRRRA